MVKRLSVVGTILLVAGAVAVAVGTGGKPGEDDKPPPKEGKKAPPTLVQVDISEEVDGRVNTSHRTQYRTVRLLWFAGLDFKSERETRWDKELKEYKPRKTGDPDFVVKGETGARMARRPTWYEGVVAYIYVAEADISIEDAAGKEIARYQLSLERSGKSRDEAIQKALERLGNYAAMAVVECAAIRSRIPEKRRAALEKTLLEIRKDVAKFGGTLKEIKPRPREGRPGGEKPKEEKGEGKDR